MPLERVQNLVIALLVAFLLISVWTGYHKGHNRAITLTMAGNAQVLAKGIQYFFQDQERYPTFLEFQNQQLMSEYVQPFPPSALTTKHCPQNLVYQSPSQKVFSLVFCIPQSAGAYAKGLNKLGPSQ